MKRPMDLLKALIIGITWAMLGAVASANAQDADAPLTNGDLWGKSSHVEKVAYIAGAADLLETEYVVQQQSGNPPSDEQSSISRFWDELHDETIDGLIETVDKWYADNPDQLDVPVIIVIWNSYVETD